VHLRVGIIDGHTARNHPYTIISMVIKAVIKPSKSSSKGTIGSQQTFREIIFDA